MLLLHEIIKESERKTFILIRWIFFFVITFFSVRCDVKKVFPGLSLDSEE